MLCDNTYVTKKLKKRKPSGRISLTTNQNIRERLLMKISITEEMRFRQKVVEYAIKYDNKVNLQSNFQFQRSK